ncbi:MAG: hypothetical protein QM802_19955 [Agriterribacter sp.]
MKRCLIISIVYLEPEWIQTKRCIDATGLPVYYVERNPKGIGSLAEAINRGYKEAKGHEYEYVWFVTNITFEPHVPYALCDSLDMFINVACIHPSFDSDHIHERNDGSGKVKSVPFVEFTSAMVRTSVFNNYPLDEDMPYWGHDPDHGVRLWLNNHAVAVDHGVQIGHTYIRNNTKGHFVTSRRKIERAMMDEPTCNALQAKYGPDWRWMFPRDTQAIEKYFQKVKELWTSSTS